MARRGSSDFSVDMSQIGSVVKRIRKFSEEGEKEVSRLVNQGIDVAYRTARARRPMLGPTLRKNATNKRDYVKRSGKVYRVSDPSAGYGVPVQTGALRASIQLEKAKTSAHPKARVWTEGVSYAKFVEFGTSRMEARPFMRPAKQYMEDAVRRLVAKAQKRK